MIKPLVGMKENTFVSSSLSENDLLFLCNLRDTNKMKMHCYRMLTKRYSRLQLGITMSSIFLNAAGVVVGAVTLNPIPIAVLSGVGIILQSFLSRSDLEKKKNGCKEAYKLYKGITDRINYVIQGSEAFVHDILTSDINLIDEIITNSDAVPINGISEKYYKKYPVIYGE